MGTDCQKISGLMGLDGVGKGILVVIVVRISEL